MAESSDESTGPEREETALREITKEELQIILDAHELWFRTGGEQGTRANLDRANLEGMFHQGLFLQGASLQGANLEEAILNNADFKRANLTGAYLSRAKLANAELKDAILRDAVLADVDLTSAKGLQGEQLAGTSLSRSTLPDDIAKFHGLEHAAEISKQARTVFLSVIGACLFCWLTLGTMTDAGLLLNSVTTPLPVIQTKVPALGFFVAAPAILLGLYLYLHLYLQNLWLCLSRLPAIFPDGRPLDQRVFPWLLVSLVRSYVTLLKKNRPDLSRLQVFVSIISAWVIAPFTALLLWFGHLPRFYWISTDMSWLLNAWLMLIAAAMAGFGMNSYLLAGQTLRGTSSRNALRRALTWTTAAPISLCFCLVALQPYDFWTSGSFRGWFIADLQRANLARVNLDKANLHWANLQEAKLRGVDLSGAKLEGAKLPKANLQRANLQRANLQGADLQGADLRADLQGANLQGANLQWANLQKADLKDANLQQADLKETDLQGAFLEGSKLQNVKYLTQQQLDGACGDEHTRLPDGLTIKPCKKKPDEEKEGEKKKNES